MPASDKRKIVTYTNKKSLFVFLTALALCVVCLCFVNEAPAVTFIAVPIIVAAAFVTDKILIVVKRDVYGDDFIRKIRKPVTAMCCVAVIFTAGCLAFGIGGYFSAVKQAENGNVIGSFQTLDEAVEFSQTNTLSDKYDCEVGALLPGENSFTLNAVFTPKNGKGDVEDFGSYKDAVLNDDGSVTVTIKGYTVEYGGQRVTYYMLNERCQGDAKIDVSDEGVRVVSNLSAIGNVLGAALGSAMMIVIATAAYIVGMLIIVIPSEIYLVLVRKKLLSEEKVSYRQSMLL